MRLNKLTYRGVTNTAGTVSIDFNLLPPGIVALVGPNGSGKSTCMEGSSGALYRDLPSRASLTKACYGKDAFIDLGFEFGGTEYRSLVKIDAEREVQEAYLYTGDGTALASGKVKEYDAMIADKIGPSSIFFASVFASQKKKGSFSGKTQAQKKELFIELLGLGHLQKISDKAKERAKFADQEIAVLRSKIADIETKLEGTPALEADLATHQEDLDKYTREIEVLRKSLQGYIEEEAAFKASGQRREDIEKTIGEIQKEITLLDEKKKDLDERRQNNAKVLAQAEQIRGAVDTLASLKERLVEAEGELNKAEATREVLATRKSEARALLDGAATCDRKLAELKLVSQKARSDELAAKDTEIRTAEKNVATCKQVISTAETNAKYYKSEIMRLQEQARILGDVPCGDSFPTCSLIASAIAAKDAIPDRQEMLREWKDGLEQGRADLGKDQEALSLLQEERKTIASSPIEETPDEIAVRAKAEQYRKEAAERTPSAEEETTNRAAITLAKATIEEHKIAIERTRKLSDLLPHLEAAETKISEYDKELARMEGERVTKEERLADHRAVLAAIPGPEKSEAIQRAKASKEAEVRQAETSIQDIQGKVAATQARLEDLRKLAPQKGVQENILTEKLRYLSHCLHLQKAYGKDGIQALEIDSAGPGVSALVNDLLHVCYGSLFSFALRTTREGDKGQQIEDFALLITNNVTGRVIDIGDLSGGEGVVVNEALGLAIAIFNTHKSGRKWETLWRDETAGALDPEAAMKYLQMLRRAIELGNFWQVIIIAHNQELWESCDARIHFQNGAVTEIDAGAFVPFPRALPQPKEQIAA